MSDVLERTLLGLRQALAVSPKNGPLWLQVAELLDEMGRDNEAVDAAREAERLCAEGEGKSRARAIIERHAPAPAAKMPVNVVPMRVVERDSQDDEDDDALTVPESERATFADVGGLDDVKEQIRMKIVLPFQRPEVFAAYGKKRGGGILLYGPPGCGKTLLARATAGECDAHFSNVAIDAILDMWYGESERKLGAVFDGVRKKERAVLFFDEVEAIGANRQHIKTSPGRSLVNQFLAELDGLNGKNDSLLVIAATNAPWHVDPALRRPGRFDRVVFVPPPDEPARVEILRLHLRDKPVDDDVRIDAIARKTAEFSGADLADLIERATEEPLREALRSGEVRPLRAEDFKRALKQTRPSTREWFATAKNYATFANTGGLYDDLTDYLRGR